MCHCCSCHILTSSVISCCTDSRQHEIELFHIIKKLKIVNRDVSDSALLQAHKKEPIRVCVMQLIIQMQLVTMCQFKPASVDRKMSLFSLKFLP